MFVAATLSTLLSSRYPVNRSLIYMSLIRYILVRWLKNDVWMPTDVWCSTEVNFLYSSSNIIILPADVTAFPWCRVYGCLLASDLAAPTMQIKHRSVPITTDAQNDAKMYKYWKIISLSDFVVFILSDCASWFKTSGWYRCYHLSEVLKESSKWFLIDHVTKVVPFSSGKARG